MKPLICKGRLLALGLLLAGLANLPSAWAACLQPPANAQVAREGALQVAWLAQPAPRVGRAFVLQVFVCPAEVELTRVDAHMPEHRHGMNYRVSLQHQGQGRWHAEGLLWHMSGHWELRLDVQHQGQKQRFVHSVQLP